ncbi:unnamed protein product, partial [Tuber aestivum]
SQVFLGRQFRRSLIGHWLRHRVFVSCNQRVLTGCLRSLVLKIKRIKGKK